MKEHSSNDFFQEILEKSRTAVYAADLESYELQYVNQEMREIACHGQESYENRKCYEYIMDEPQPCKFCKLEKCQVGGNLQQSITFPLNGRHYGLSGTLIPWEGKVWHVEFVQDITEKHDQFRKLELMLDEMPAGIVVILCRKQGVELKFCNREFLKLLGFAANEGKESNNRIVESIHPESRTILRAMIEKLAHEDEAEVTLQVQNSAGKYSWVEARMTASFRSSEYMVLYGVCSNVDALMENLKREENHRMVQEQIYRKRLEIPDVESDRNLFLYHFDLTEDELISSQTDCSYVEETANTHSYQELLESGFLQSPYEEERDHLFQKLTMGELMEEYEQGQERINLHQRCNMMTGMPLWISVVANLVMNPMNDHLEIVLYGFDDTPKQTRIYLSNLIMNKVYDMVVVVYLQENRARFLHISNECGYDGPYFVEDLKSVIIQYIKQNRITGLDNEETALKFMKTYLEKGLPDDGARCNYKRIDSDGKPHAMQGVFYTQDKKNQVMVYLARDVTVEREQEYQYVSQFEKALQEANFAVSSRNELAIQVYRESKQPLTTILDMVDELSDQLKDETVQRNLEQIRRAVGKVISGISEKSGVHIQEMGRASLYLEQAVITECLNHVIASLEQIRRERRIRIITDADASVCDPVMMDRQRFETVLLNLLQGMVECCDPGAQIFCQIELIGETETRMDHSIRLGAKMKEKAVKFIQSVNYSIIRNMVTLIGGELSVAGKDAFLEFTMTTHFEKPRPEQKKTRLQDDLYFAGKRVLLISGHREGMERVSSELEQVGLLSEKADNYEQAVNMMEQHLPGYYDIILYNKDYVTPQQLQRLSRKHVTIGLDDIDQINVEDMLQDILSNLKKKVV